MQHDEAVQELSVPQGGIHPADAGAGARDHRPSTSIGLSRIPMPQDNGRRRENTRPAREGMRRGNDLPLEGAASFRAYARLLARAERVRKANAARGIDYQPPIQGKPMKPKMTTLASLRRERNDWKERALFAEQRVAALIAFYDGMVQQMARMLNIARNVK
jgi:hypothetical protein